MLATGATVIMAIRVLIDHGVPEEHISFLSLLSAPEGIFNVSYVFPKVRICTTAVDEKLNDAYFIVPGCGNFGDRYFGTD